MKNNFIFISNIAAGSLHIILALFLIFRLLSSQRPDRKSIAAGIGGGIIISTLLSWMGLPDFYRMALEALWITFCASRFQKADPRMSLFTGIFYEIGVAFWQFLFAAWSGVLFRTPAFLDSETGYGQIAIWLFHGLLAALFFYLLKRKNLTEKEGFRLVSAIVLAGFFAIITLSQQKILSLPDDTLNMWTILAIVLLMSVLIFTLNRQYETEKELASLKSQQAELLERDYTALNNAYAVNAKLFHDFHNHIGALRQLLSHEHYGKAIQYLDELQAPVREMTDTHWTGDETIDYLINSRAATAAAAQIQMQMQVEFPQHTNIQSADLCAILGNLLDNALEAAKQVPEPEQRFVNLTIRRINQMLVIKTENSFFSLPVKEDGRLKTIKSESGLHGWGLKSAQTAAEKYDGMVQTSYNEGVFRAVATLSYQGITLE